MPRKGHATVALLEEDPDLAVAVPPEEIEHARRLVRVPSLALEVGPWDVTTAAVEPVLGLIVLEGLVTVHVVVADRVASQIAGPGDVLHRLDVPDALLPARVGHYVSERARIAVLDESFIAAVRRWPSLLITMLERLRVQERRLAVLSAVGKLRRVEERLVALLWHLAERWGRVTPEGVVVPLSLTHETLGRLAGAKRPTVTLALQELSRTGEIVRRPEGGFLLGQQSRALLEPDVDSRPQARPLTAQLTKDAVVTEARLTDRHALQRRIAALNARLDVLDET